MVNWIRKDFCVPELPCTGPDKKAQPMLLISGVVDAPGALQTLFKNDYYVKAVTI